MPGRIEDYAIIGDLQTAALVGRDGGIDWLCLPRFDSGAVFAALLGDRDNGRWRLAPTGAGTCASRAYRGDTLVLDTVWQTPNGAVKVTDFMPQRETAPDLVRIVEGLSGEVAMRSEATLRFDYGSVVPWVRRTDHHRVAIAGPDSVWLRTEPPIPMYGKDMRTYADFTVTAGQRIAFVLTWHPSHEKKPRRIDPYRALEQSVEDWQRWSAGLRYDGPYRPAVLRSLITLKALTYAPSGGIAAAATTSLPEEIGGVRNWDYRYCWLRDAALTLDALISCGFLAEAQAWRDWLLRAVAGDPADLQIMYGIAGERRLPEYEVPWLTGYEGSAPVRIGNAAAGQLQLDVYGEVLDSLFLARERGMDVVPHAWNLQRALMDFLQTTWREPDEGLWEVRGPRRHFVHSKVMAWVAADRAVRTVEAAPRLRGDVERWRAMRAQVHAEVCEKGYDPRRNTFTQFYGSTELDAATLLIPQVGFLPASDPRVIGTVEAVRRELDHGGFVRRYTPDAGGVDGLPGSEGAFLACSFWLADALHRIGRRGEAVELFEKLLGLRNDVGLLAEEWDPRAGRLLGNFPQAFSHIGLVSTALTLADGGARGSVDGSGGAGGRGGPLDTNGGTNGGSTAGGGAGAGAGDGTARER